METQFIITNKRILEERKKFLEQSAQESINAAQQIVSMLPEILSSWGRSKIGKEIVVDANLKVILKDTPYAEPISDYDLGQYWIRFPVTLVEQPSATAFLITAIDLTQLDKPIAQCLDETVWRVTMLKDTYISESYVDISTAETSKSSEKNN